MPFQTCTAWVGGVAELAREGLLAGVESLVGQQLRLHEELFVAVCAVKTRACALSLATSFAVPVSIGLATMGAEKEVQSSTGRSISWQTSDGLTLISDGPPSCPTDQPVLPIFHQPRQNQAEGGAAKIKANPTKVRQEMDLPVAEKIIHLFPKSP